MHKQVHSSSGIMAHAEITGGNIEFRLGATITPIKSHEALRIANLLLEAYSEAGMQLSVNTKVGA